MKKIISIILATVLMATALPLSASAASLYFNQSSFSLGVGESVVVSTNLYSKISRNTTKYVSKKTLNKKSIRIKGLKEGKTVLTAKKGSQKKKITVTVKKAPKKISLNVKTAPGVTSKNVSNVTIAIGESVDFNSVVPEGTASKLRKYSYVSNTTTVNNKKVKVCTYRGSGIFKGLNVGTSTIKCTTYNGKSAEATIKVIKSRQYTTADDRKSVENLLSYAVKSLGVKDVYQAKDSEDEIGFNAAEREFEKDKFDNCVCFGDFDSSWNHGGCGKLEFSHKDFNFDWDYYYMNDKEHFKRLIKSDYSWPCYAEEHQRWYVEGKHPPQIMVYWWESNPKGMYDVLSYYFIWW